MEEQHNLDLESSVNSENSTESESFNFLPLGIILTLISGISGIIFIALPSQPINNPSSTKLQLFSPLIPTVPPPANFNPVPPPAPIDFITGNLIAPNPIKSNDIFGILENTNPNNNSVIELNNLEKNIYLTPDPEPFNIGNYSFKIESEEPNPREMIENSMTPLNLTANRPQYQRITQQPPEVQPSPPVPVVTEIDGVELTLNDVIILGLENNRTIKNQYLDRIVQRQDLIVAEDKFNPNFTPSLSINWSDITQGNSTVMTNGLVLSAGVVIKIPTGGELNMGWVGQRQQQNYQGSGGSDRDVLRQNLALTFKQPLLRGAGQRVNRADIEIARIKETINLLDLKSTLIDKITEIIISYRSVLQAQEKVEIDSQSLENAKKTVENTQFLIDAGRIAKAELITVQSQVADQEIALLSSRNNLRQRRLDLLELLDIDEDVNIIASQNLEIQPPTLDIDRIRQSILEHQPSYLKAKLNLENAKTQLVIDENKRRWNIDFETTVTHQPAPNIIDNKTELSAGLTFSKALGDRSIERDFQRSRVNVLKLENDLKETIQNVNTEVTKNLQDIELNFKKVELSRQATKLAELQLSNEMEKIKLGFQGHRLLDLVDFQSKLNEAQNNELNAKIDYLNALTKLDKSLGITLDILGITLEQQPEQNNE
ncbi:TolC family protein [Planktothrix agardhii 1029]|uniref:TolC family protein n=1 Tax=Planktothrix agardhii TaxID=1160 RepID=UPI001D0AF201|nr:TolC family protein [Planktothrix agardhii]MCB8766415.1 TolC family protein [Planktothrix agardhii 1809]MCB8779945.1 TolC family protein [Planktothrix agardhii 1031]MCB8784371.1 TolC family protein [Planktothrix agardhii 1808]MCF3564607.1 TolC family protein [Planktothrix agardhii 1807]MCF3587967.1 TolC family protein [Planktothrix agardhii 1029]